MDPVRFFAELGYRVRAERDADGVWWADLIPDANPDSVISRYGRGDSEVLACQRAMERWQQEQIGNEKC